jgi:hypothetical protein
VLAGLALAATLGQLCGAGGGGKSKAD